MIPIDLLRQVKTLICHDYCSDGLASALILKDFFPDAAVQFIQYGTDAHKTLVAEPGMLFCDFSPPEDRVREFVNAGAIVLDHHATAKPLVEAFGERGRFGDEKDHPGVCGAVLAYREVWGPRFEKVGPGTFERVQRFATLAGVRDTWQKDSPDWVEACQQAQVLAFAPNSFWMGKGLAAVLQEWPETWAPIGKILYDRQQKDVERAAKKAYRFTTQRGTRVALLASKGLASDVKEYLKDEVELVVGLGFAYEPGIDPYPKLILSTRSNGKFDCGAFCKRNGGGGHTRAAGCTLAMSEESLNPYHMAEWAITYHEMQLHYEAT